MKFRLLISLFCLAAFTACSTSEPTPPVPSNAPSAPAATERSEPFSLRPGTYWVYSGTVKWAVANAAEPSEKRLDWKMEVMGLEHVGRYEVAVMKGHPQDLAWYEESKPRSDYLIVRDGTKYYHLKGSRIPEAAQLESKLDFNSLFLEVPPPMGCLARDPDIKGDDEMYCWAVSDPMPVRLDGVKGVPADTELKGFELAFRTNPDQQLVTFVPGLGITSYVYEHHGTVSEVSMKLTEFHLGAR